MAAPVAMRLVTEPGAISFTNEGPAAVNAPTAVGETLVRTVVCTLLSSQSMWLWCRVPVDGQFPPPPSDILPVVVRGSECGFIVDSQTV